MQTRIPCVLMRGGTSKGPFFLAEDLPSDPETRDRVLLAAMGSPDLRQIDGIGGANPLTSKVAIISRSTRPDADVDYLFAQVLIERAFVDTSPNCGNMLVGVGPFAIEQGLVPAGDPETKVRIYNVNTKAVVEATVQTPGGRVTYSGDVAISGVPGTAAPIALNFSAATGSKTGKLLPTGSPVDVIDGIRVSCVDFAVAMMLVDARALGKTGYETKAELDADKEFFARMEALRVKAGALMGLGDVSGLVVPKVSLVAPPQHGGSVSSRYFVPTSCHNAHAVTGGLCLAVAAMIPGSVASEVVDQGPSDQDRTIRIEHPAGFMDIDVTVQGSGSDYVVKRAGVVRTARSLFEGNVLIPAEVWAGRPRVAAAAQ